MKRLYATPVMEVIFYDAEDIVCSSREITVTIDMPKISKVGETPPVPYADFNPPQS